MPEPILEPKFTKSAAWLYNRIFHYNRKNANANNRKLQAKKIKSVVEITYYEWNLATESNRFSYVFSVAIRDEKQPKSRFRWDVLATEKVKIGTKIGSGISFGWTITKSSNIRHESYMNHTCNMVLNWYVSWSLTCLKTAKWPHLDWISAISV